MIKHWPLRWKIALYAAALGIVATLAGAATTWTLMQHFELKRLDQQIAAEAEEFFSTFPANLGARIDQDALQRFTPFAWHNRMIQLRDADGALLYQSPNLPESFAPGDTGPATVAMGRRKIRVTSFHGDDLRLLVAADLTEIHDIGIDIIWGMFGAIPTVIVVVAIGGRWVARCAVAPVEQIRRAAREITPQHLDRRLPVPPTNDEIAGLIAVLNDTFDRLQASYEQAVRFSADASHQLKTPITVLRAAIEELLTAETTPDNQRPHIEALLHQVYRLTSITEGLLLLARVDAGRLQLERDEFNLTDVLSGVLDDARVMAESQRLTVESSIPDSVQMVGDRRAVSLIAQNLVENAVKFSRNDGHVRIAVEAVNGTVDLVVGNNGEPIPPDRVSHIFERFYRAKGDGRIPGNGLGLTIARELATASRGDLRLLRSDEEWTEFRLRLPRS